MPDINFVGMMMRDHIFTISEETLCFTEEEITEYFSRPNLNVTRGDIRNIHDDTQGWAFALNLIGRSLAKEQKYERYALEAMKKNISRLIESEISGAISDRLWRFLLRISLIEHLAADLIKVLAGEDDEIIKEMEQVNAYIRYDHHLDSYMIHHLFLDYLRQNQLVLTDDEKRETYKKAGEWCDANGYHIDAFSYYEKAGNYGSIMRKIATHNIQIPQEMARYALEILDRAPHEAKISSPIFPSMHLRLKANLGQLEEAETLARMYAEEFEAQPESPERNRCLTGIYAAWAFLRGNMCTYTDVYDFDFYYEKMGEYYDKNPFEIIGSYRSLVTVAFASAVGTSRAGAQEEYIEAIARSTPYTSRILKGIGVGYEELLRGELCFFRGEFDEAEKYLKQTADKAGSCDQYVTYNRALVYMMRIAFFRGDFSLATERLEAMESLLSEKDYGIRYTVYDIACGFYRASLGQPDQIPEWLKGDFSAYTHPSYIENYGNRVKASYHYHTRKYSSLLAFIESETEKDLILYGRIELMILKSLILYRLKKRDEAIAALTEAYELSKSNGLTTFFIQYGKDMRTLTASAIKDGKCTIPKEWLESINRKASAHAKRTAKMITDYRIANNIGDEISLTEREIEILRDLSQGLSRTEIAASQNISVNTVKMTINVIYDKLCVTSLADAIRVAVSRKIV